MKFNFQGSNRIDSVCDIEIIGNLVIATEIPENEGQSITNAVEELATSVCLRNAIPMQDLIWVEHYHYRPGEYDLVHFIFDGEKLTCPYWKRLSLGEFELLKQAQEKGSEVIE